MTDHIRTVLTQFGLNQNEIAVYLAALNLEETSPFELARLTRIPRTTIYDILMSLSLKGLVSLTQSDGLTKQQTKIRAKNPSTLRELVRTRQHQLASLEVDIVDILPDLKQTFQKETPHADFQFLPGISGAKAIYFSERDSDSSLPIIAFENMMSMDAFGKESINRDVNKGTETHLNKQPAIKELIAITDWTRHVITYQYARDPNYIKAREMRCLELPGFMINQRMTIQGHRIGISCVKDDEAWGLKMNSASLAETFTSLFNALWTFATPITDEFVQNLGPNEFFEAEQTKK